MTKIDNVTEMRKTLLRNGYTPLPNIDKVIKTFGWQTMVVDEAAINRWGRSVGRDAIGLRLDGPLVVLDNDTLDPVLCEQICDAWTSHLPQLFMDESVPLLERGNDASCKVAFFFRCPTVFSIKHTNTWRVPGSGDDAGDGHKVEAYGSGKARQFGAFGPHDLAKGTTYEWPVDSPLTIKLADVPEITEEQIDELLAIAERIFEAAGLEKVVPLIPDQMPGASVYDLTPEMMFQCNDGQTRDLAALKRLLKRPDVEGMRCSASFFDPSGKNRTRCMAHLTARGLMIYDYRDDIIHRELKDKPLEQVDLAAAMEKLSAAEKLEPVKPGDSCDTAAAKIRSQYAYCLVTDSAIPLDGVREPRTIQALARGYEPWSLVQFRGNVEIRTNPVAAWMQDESKHTVEGVQMRPDQPAPIFTDEKGHQWVNSYRPPIHDAEGGDASIGIEYLTQQLASDPVEAVWFRKWAAYKIQNPAVPGPAVIMVANNVFGTGRSTLEALLSKLTGYVKTVKFSHFAGTDGQSSFNGWAFDSLFVIVNEAQLLKGSGGRYAMKHDTYEVMKELIEPRAAPRMLVVKNVNHRQALSFASYILLTNSIDAFPIPAHDRRCFVMTNGQPRPPEYWEALYAWMDDPANIAALYRWLLATDLSDYSPYATPPMTEAKAEMADAARSDLDAAFDETLLRLKGTGSELVSLKHIEDAVAIIANEDNFELPDAWRSIVLSLIKTSGKLFRIGKKDGANWKPAHGGGARRYPTYAWSKESSRKWTTAHPEVVRNMLLRCGPLNDAFVSAFKALRDAAFNGGQ